MLKVQIAVILQRWHKWAKDRAHCNQPLLSAVRNAGRTSQTTSESNPLHKDIFKKMLSISLTQDSSYAKIHHVDIVPCALYQSWNCTEERCPELLSFSEEIKIRTRLLKGAWTSIFLKIRTEKFWVWQKAKTFH